MNRLQKSIHCALDDDATKYILLKGSSDAYIFCHSMSLAFVASDPSDRELSASFQMLSDIAMSINHSNKPTIAMVSGSVIAGGVGLVAACDIVLADLHANFSLSAGLYGLLPGVIIPFILQRVSQSKLKYMIFTADTVRGEKAVQWGLSDQYFSNEVSMHHYVAKLFKALRRIHASSVSNTKKLLSVLAHKQLANLGIELSLASIADPACKKVIKDYITYGILPSTR
jgi:enoyl-CoA hydratase/carnithine racemase